MDGVTVRNWPKVTVEEVAVDVTVGHVGPMADEYLESGVPFLRSLSVEKFGIRDEGLKFISPDFHRKLKKSALTPGDVVIVRTGKPGTCAVIPDWLGEANCSDLVIVRCGPRIRPHFLCYIVNSIAAGHIDAHTVGAVQQHFNVGSARTLSFLLPPIEEQDRVLALLRALDDKIELNRKMNATLEAMARALFRDWFVDFGPTRARMAGGKPYLSPELWSLFPDRLDAEGKPEGWEAFRLEQIAEHHKSTISPSAQPHIIFEHFSLPAFDRGQSPALDLGETIKSNKTLVPPDAVLLSKLNPEILRVWLPEAAGNTQQIASTEFLAYTGRNGAQRGLLFCLFSDNQFREMMQSMVTGTSKSHQRISPPDLLRREVLTGCADMFAEFEAMAAPLLHRVLVNRAESRTLAQTRDLLLPRLMSGELLVAEAETLASEVA